MPVLRCPWLCLNTRIQEFWYNKEWPKVTECLILFQCSDITVLNNLRISVHKEHSLNIATSSYDQSFLSLFSSWNLNLQALYFWWAPSVAFGGMAFLGCFVALLLPDSRNQPLTETIEQFEALHREAPGSLESRPAKKYKA